MSVDQTLGVLVGTKFFWEKCRFGEFSCPGLGHKEEDFGGALRMEKVCQGQL